MAEVITTGAKEEVSSPSSAHRGGRCSGPVCETRSQRGVFELTGTVQLRHIHNVGIYVTVVSQIHKPRSFPKPNKVVLGSKLPIVTKQIMQTCCKVNKK